MKTDFAITAIRLKELRTTKKLSHEKLREQLLAMGADISVSSLKDYEISDAFHAKAGKVKGMRIENLFALSEFYGVSADYLLGRTNVKSPNAKIQDICNRLNLSEEAVEVLAGEKKMCSEASTPLMAMTSFAAMINALATQREDLNEIEGRIAHAATTMQFINTANETALGNNFESPEIIEIRAALLKYGLVIQSATDTTRQHLEAAAECTKTAFAKCAVEAYRQICEATEKNLDQ